MRLTLGIPNTISYSAIAASGGQSVLSLGGSDDELKRQFDQLVGGTCLTQSTIAPATAHLTTIVALNSADPAANSLYEHLAYQILQVVVATGDAALFERMLQLFSGPHTLYKLRRFLRDEGLARQFDLPTPRSSGDVRFILESFLNTIRERPEADYFMQTFAKALVHPKIGRLVKKALLLAAEMPLPRLTINRLFHLLIDLKSLHKIRSFIALLPELRLPPLDDPRVLPESGDSIDGTIHTAFVRQAELAAGIRDLMKIAARYDEKDLSYLRKRWEEKIAELDDAECGNAELNAKNVAALLEFHGTALSMELAGLLGGDDSPIELPVVPEVSASAKLQKRRGKSTPVKARFKPAKGKHQRAQILILELEATQNRVQHARMWLDRVAWILHEYIHLKQFSQYGPRLFAPHSPYVTEMWAYAPELSFRLLNGDNRGYRMLSALSPFGIGWGIHNGIEQMYGRGMMIPIK